MGAIETVFSKEKSKDLVTDGQYDVLMIILSKPGILGPDLRDRVLENEDSWARAASRATSLHQMLLRLEKDGILKSKESLKKGKQRDYKAKKWFVTAKGKKAAILKGKAYSERVELGRTLLSF